MQGVICRLLQGRIKRGDGHESLNLPFPFFSKRRERKGGGLAGDRIRKKGAPAKNAGERRVGFPRAFRSEAEPAASGRKTVPRRMERLRRGLWTEGNEPYADPRLSPRGLPNAAGRFHRGATRGELASIISGRAELCGRT